MAKHPKGLWYIIAIYMWEYFSFYGMRSLLILYLTKQLLFNDDTSYSIYGSFASLIYMTPIIGGLLADRILGFKRTVVLGAIFMSIGHLIIGINGEHLLFFGMSFIICGYGYFKSNIPCLLGQIYKGSDANRDSAFTLLYLGGNIGSICAPIACGIAAETLGWDFGFALAGIGMVFGLCIFFIGSKHIPNIKPDTVKFSNIFISFISFLIIVVCYLAIKYQYEVYLISIATIFSIIFFIKILINIDILTRKRLVLIVPFMVFGILFWVFDEQMFTSVELFIERNINTSIFNYTLPASVFTAINPIAIIIGGSLLSIVWSRLKGLDNNNGRMIKFLLGFSIQLLSFVLLVIAAKNASVLGKTSAIWVILSLFLLGVSELFIDPIALSEITNIKDKRYTGFLSAMYFLFTGSIAGYIAAKFAKIASFDGLISESSESLVSQAKLFYHLFSYISIILFLMICVWFVLTILIKIINK